MIFHSSVFAQIKNSEENVVANIYNASVNSFEFSGGETTLQIKLTPSEWSTSYVDKSNPNVQTAKKLHAIFIKAGITNTKKFIDLDKFDFKENNGLLFGLQYNYSFKEVFKRSDNSNPFSMFTASGGITYSYDKFNYYNQSTNEISKNSPSTLSANGNYNRYFFNYEKSFFTLVVSLNAIYNLSTYNKDELINYAEVNNGTLNADIFATRSFDGKYGILDDKSKTGELAVSFPIIFDSQYSNLPHFVPVPYISYEFFSYSKPKLTSGFSIGLLSKNIFKKEAVNAEHNGAVTRIFNDPSFLSIGMDWTKQDGKSSSPNYFITGSIKFE